MSSRVRKPLAKHVLTKQIRMQLPILNVISQPDLSSSDSSQQGDDSLACGSVSPLFEPSRRLPPWLRREVPKGNANHFTSGLLSELRLETVCENAKCPNRMECYSQKTATFMILGNVCTRPCFPRQARGFGTRRARTRCGSCLASRT